MSDVVQAKKDEIVGIPEIWNQKMWETGKGFFANRAFKANYVHAKCLKESDNKPGIMAVAM